MWNLFDGCPPDFFQLLIGAEIPLSRTYLLAVRPYLLRPAWYEWVKEPNTEGILTMRLDGPGF